MSDKDFSKTKDIIGKVTQDLLEHERKVISSTPIIVKVSKKDLIDLTLIDLPGLTYREIDGVDIAEEVKEMLYNHI